MDGDHPPPVDGETAAIPREALDRFGKYRSLGRIGQGGMAEVFLAVGRGPAGFNKLVVIKRLRESVASEAAYREMFLDEARLAARLNHPNVVQTYEVFEHEGAYFITMEFLEGQPLSALIRECARWGRRIPRHIQVRIVSDVLCGLHYAHEAHDFDGTPLQIVHRDVSPQNIFLTYNGQIKVVDFGIAKAQLSSTRTQAGFFKGKAAYMAPEQLEGGPIDRRVDVFTAGIVLWELLAGRKLMAAESTARTLVRLLQDPVPRLTDIVPDIDPKLEAIVSRALERNPAARYQTAGQMRIALELYLSANHLVVGNEEIGGLVAEVFRDIRAAMQEQIREQMAYVSEFPASGSTATAASAVDPLDVDLPQTLQAGSVSGITLNRTRSQSSLRAVQPTVVTTGLVAAVDPPAKSSWLPAVIVAAIAAVAIAAIVALVAHTRVAPPAPLPAPALATSPIVTRAPEPALGATETPLPTQPRNDPNVQPSPTAAAPPPLRSGPGAPVWHPARPSWVDRQTGPASRSAAPPSTAANAPQASPPPASPPPEPEPPRAAAPAPPPQPPVAPPPTQAPTQEGRKFRTTL
jgi:serine/threonine protein kinase